MAQGKSLKIRINNEYTKLVPALSDASYEDLEQSIKENGLWQPITINTKGIVLDGHHRFRACQELGIDLIWIVKEFDDDLKEKLFVIDCNLNRRHLNTFGRVELALTKKPILEEIARKNMALAAKGDRNLTPLGRVDEKIASDAHTSRDTVRKVEFLLETANSGTINRLRQDRSKISKEWQRIQKALEKQNAQKLAKTLSATSNANSIFDLRRGDIRELGKTIPEGSIDLIFTDPPYKEESISLYAELAKLAERVLKPGGSLVTFIGHYALFEIGKLIAENSQLVYHWQVIVKHNGRTARMWVQRVWPKYKPMLWYYKPREGQNGPTMFSDIDDLIESEAPEKLTHPWEQSTIEVKHMITPLTVEGMTVLDPFMGSGTTGIAALKLERRFIGIEIDNDYFAIAKAHLMNAQKEYKSLDTSK